jgi:plastocyanin
MATVTRRTVLSTAASGFVLIAGCTNGDSGGDNAGGNEPSVEETTSVTLSSNQFEPRNIKVDAETEVTWSNDDSTAHTVTNAADNWNKDTEVSGGGEASHTFDESGVFDVYCTYHGSADLSGMSMKIAVGDATIENPLGGDGDDGGDGGDDGLY